MDGINQPMVFFFTPLNKQCISCSSDKLVSDKLVVDDPRYNINMTMVKKKKSLLYSGHYRSDTRHNNNPMILCFHQWMESINYDEFLIVLLARARDIDSVSLLGIWTNIMPIFHCSF